MEVPYYLRPTDPNQSGDVIFNIPVVINPPGVVYTEDQVSSIWTQGLEGIQDVATTASNFVTETVSTTIDVIKRTKDNAVGLVSTPIDAIQSAFNYTMWIMVAGVLTLIYLAVK